jgi:hypothetical protein
MRVSAADFRDWNRGLLRQEETNWWSTARIGDTAGKRNRFTTG